VSERFDKLLVLDLDETLIQAHERLDRAPEFQVGPYQIIRRPGLDRFLEFALNHFRGRDFAGEPIELLTRQCDIVVHVNRSIEVKHD
jgi:hypothetical protein